ncbi:hypothetical protein GCM10009127_13450 [Alteraurantiacibacter aestuarii]|uniref:Uncharacterized protein n=1 Tax=Alteraurantiacibacter aestuarii TaxID=650004 RepID=A0A844ZJU1_9SPHN|nr:hypothetical protein [Alteraurantiacibacter aestuarii]MXO88065.1 hypothetical protein [Alteraurantiacibacter aestuarii]
MANSKKRSKVSEQPVAERRSNSDDYLAISALIASISQLDVETNLTSALQNIADVKMLNTEPQAISEQLGRALDVALGIYEGQETSPGDECGNLPSDITTPCNTYDTSIADAKYADRKDQVAANTAYKSAVNAWNTAVAVYNDAVSAAKVDVDHAQTTAMNAIGAKFNDDSSSRCDFLIATLKTDIATAVQAYVSAVEAAGSALASAAGTMMTAYVTYIGATENTVVAKLLTTATAEQTFWQSVESIRDQ